MNTVSFFILNIVLNSLLSFFTVFILVEAIIFLFRIPQGRVAAILRMIPIFKLPFDLFLYDFSRWSYANGINPLNCEEGTRMISVMIGWINKMHEGFFLPINSGIQFTVHENLTFTLADILAYSLNPECLTLLTLLLAAISVTLVVAKLSKYYQSIKSLNSLAKTAQEIGRSTGNASLATCLKKYKLQILTSSSLAGSPFVVGLTNYRVYVPGQLLQTLSRREYDAILAHELEHIKHKDSLVRLCLDLISSIFWWVPTKWLHKRIEEGQEVGCDFKCQKYGIQPQHLASAICKSVYYSLNKPTHIFAHHLTKNAVHKRVNLLIKPKSIRFKKIQYVCCFLAMAVAFSVIFLGRFWIF